MKKVKPKGTVRKLVTETSLNLSRAEAAINRARSTLVTFAESVDKLAKSGEYNVISDPDVPVEKKYRMIQWDIFASMIPVANILYQKDMFHNMLDKHRFYHLITIMMTDFFIITSGPLLCRKMGIKDQDVIQRITNSFNRLKDGGYVERYYSDIMQNKAPRYILTETGTALVLRVKDELFSKFQYVVEKGVPSLQYTGIAARYESYKVTEARTAVAKKILQERKESIDRIRKTNQGKQKINVKDEQRQQHHRTGLRLGDKNPTETKTE